VAALAGRRKGAVVPGAASEGTQNSLTKKYFIINERDSEYAIKFDRFMNEPKMKQTFAIFVANLFRHKLGYSTAKHFTFKSSAP